MRAWVITHTAPISQDSQSLKRVSLPIPMAGPGKVLIKVECCGVCHTELDEIKGRTPPPSFPIIPGHQIVGHIAQVGPNVQRWSLGQRVGLAWIYGSCGHCRQCQEGHENLCDNFIATGRDCHGGFADYVLADGNYCIAIPSQLESVDAAPLLCAGAIGYRSLKLAALKNGDPLGLTGFGASNHLVMKMAQVIYPDSPIFVFARSEKQRQHSLNLGANWAGDITDKPPSLCQSIIDTTPAWNPIMSALLVLRPGGRLVINAIRKQSSDLIQLQSLDYSRHLWLEKEIKSVANVTKNDVQSCIALAAMYPIIPNINRYAFECANEAINSLKKGNIVGANVLVMRD